jgi:two-component system sensor histidine kinase UhpB
MEKRAVSLNSRLLEITRHRGFCNQRLADLREVLEQRRRSAEARERLRAGANFVRALEADRGRIARDLHDNAGQSLVGILLNLELVERQLGSAKAEALARLERSRKLASLALEQIRRTSHDLHPPEWSGDFRDAVESLVETMAARSKMQVETAGINLPPSLPAALKTTLYRVIQEALVNALRHSAASRIDIRASIELGEAHLVVEDDGCGFDVHSLPAQGTGIGLKSLRQRVTALGGRLEVSAAPGRGTRIEVFLPVREGAP